MLTSWRLFWASIIVAIGLGLLGIFPPSPKGTDYKPEGFSAMRAMTDVNVIAAKPHPTGSAENAKVRAYLAKRMTTLGLEVSTSESLLPPGALARMNKRSGSAKTEQTIVNVIGVLPGQDRSKPALLLMAHHDTVWDSPGAADDTIGIASIFEIIRALKTSGPIKRDLIVLLTDGEELGLNGARHFFQTHPLKDRVGAIINFEARGGGGTANMFQTSANNGEAAKLYARAVKTPSTSSLSIFVYNALPNDTDLTPALEGNYVAYNIANIGRAEHYHSGKSSAQELDRKTLQHMGMQGLDLTRALLAADSLPAPKPDATFFDAFGLFTVIYSPYWGWAFLGLGALFCVLAADLKTMRKEILIGAGKMIGFLGFGGLGLFVLNRVSGGGAGAEYYDRLAAIPKLEGLAVFFIVAALFIALGTKRVTANGRLGLMLPLLIIAIAGQALAPTATYFLSLPILMCGAGSWVSAQWPEHKFGAFVVAFIGALVAGYMVYLEHQLLLGVGPDLLWVTILPASLMLLALAPLYPGASTRTVRGIAIAGLALAVITALWIRFDAPADTVPVYASGQKVKPVGKQPLD